jgi:xanthine/CO dehydrogenase XdhC/CoxF family maturation factor
MSRSEALGRADLFFEVSVPPPQLVIFGAGPDAVPLVRDARELGFTVRVVDIREGFLTADRFPGATLVSRENLDFAPSPDLPSNEVRLVLARSSVRSDA